MEQEYNTEPEITTGGHGAEIAAVFLAAILCASVAYFFGLNHDSQIKKEASLSVVQTTKQAEVVDPFATVDISATAAYVFDVKRQKVIFSKNPNLILPLASITKIMTAAVATDLLPQNATISIDKKALSKDGDSGLLVNEKWSFKNLLDYTLAVSSNDGAAAVAQAASPNFVEKMNEKAKSLNLSSMTFFNETGLDESISQSGGYGSASDLSKFFEYTLKTHPEIFSATAYSRFNVASLDKVNHVAVNTDSDVDKIPGIMASKTGFTDLAGGNLAVIYDAGINYPVIAIVLGSTYDGRFADMAALIGAANATLSLQK